MLFGIESNAAQIELLHDCGNTLGADFGAAFGQHNTDFLRAIPLAAVVKGLLHQKHELRLLLVALAAVCTAKIWL